MRDKLILCLFSIHILFSCQSINSNREKLCIPQNTVFFTFDDGPDEYTTAKLLDVLGKYQIKALFCLLGENAEQYPDLVKRIYDEGHLIINHGYSEKHASLMGNDEFRDNLLHGEAAIAAPLELDRLPRLLYRPHGGYFNSQQKRICTEEGYLIIPVTIRVFDAVLTAADQKQIVKETINMVKRRGGGMILLHDARDSHHRREKELERNPGGPFNRTWISETVEEIIIALLDMGYDLQGEMTLFD